MSKRTRKKIEPGLFLIDGVVYGERSKDGKLTRRKAPMQGSAALNTNGKPTAALRQWFRGLCDQVDNAQWEALEANRQRSSYPTVELLCRAYSEIAAAEYAAHGEPRPSTAMQNVQAFKRVALACGVGDDGRVDDLTATAIEKWVSTFCAGYSDEHGERARTSAWSQLAQAKGLWTRWTLPYYDRRAIKIPECLKAWPTPKRNHAPAYHRPPDALRKATMEWYAKLKDVSKGMWVGATLMLQFAMRPGDAAELKWQSITGEPGARVLRYVPSKTRGRTASSRSVTWPVSDALYDELRARGGSEYVVPGESPTARYDVFQHAMNPAMRSLGWDEATYGKACYELRKLCVDAVYRKFGLERAVQISGDNASTILKFYADPQVEGLSPVDVSTIV